MLGNKPGFAPRCERLEGRECPAAQVFQFGSFLLVVGDAAANTVAITDLGGGRLTVAADGKTSVRTDVRSVLVVTGAGDDSVTYNVFAGTAANLTGVRLVSVVAGAGNDSVSLDGSALNKSLTFGVNGGSGDDDISVSLQGVALGNSVNLFLSGASGNDSVDVSADGEIDGLLNVRVNGGVGVDTLSADIDASAGSTGQVVGILAGSFGNDTLNMSVTGAGLGGLTSLTAIVNGGVGTDTAVTTANVTEISIEA
jgi:hypothetical protein